MTQNQTKRKFKKDRYSRTRGGRSNFFNIFCSACNTHVVLYQKDGPGALLRMYIDRIVAPLTLAALQDSVREKKDLENLHCVHCNALIATPMVYEPENRLAFRMVPGSFSKKVSDGMYPPPNL